MSFEFLLPLLSMFTLLGAVVFAYVSQQKLIDRMNDPNAPKSTLAADVPNDAKPADV
ncbi:hypothetical protein [Jannaschia pohangensis]|uniref:Uncharacterized protein n=1 Tax=Jannaschia pohangensis TaxID=390807 RepID=A0A1I3S429_9RHOB|nr:hypothetical protein [Jannaschia pohangensis]SFJ52321.1 hypothetical protein SAMN04488095_2973 [Jannaschia pohangensis]